MSSDEFGSNSFVRVPPDSTGKRTSTLRTYALDYVSGLLPFHKDDEITGQTSGAMAVVLKVSGTTSAGTLYVLIEEGSAAVEFTASEILLHEGLTHATLSTATAIHTATTSQVGKNNPLNGQYISSRGASHVRYTEGDQLIDAFGVTKTSQARLVDQITFQYNTNTLRFSDATMGVSSSITHLTNSNSIALDVGIENGAYVQRTSHIYYPYHPGFGALTECTVLCGDTGKDGIIRRWGRYDDSDGVYFEQSGSAISVNLRSSAGGSVVTTKISQSAWSVDHLDGGGGTENNSGIVLAPDKLNLYWIDYAWLGAGQVRFGIYAADGTRIVAHKIENTGVNVLPYMKRGNLPFRCELSNSQVTASPSRLAITCIGIKNDGIDVTPESKFGTQYAYVTPQAVSASSTVWTPLVAWRGTPTINGISNRFLSVPGSISGYTTEPLSLNLYAMSVLNTGSWTQAYYSGLEFDASASQVLGGVVVNSWFVEASSSFNYKVAEHFSFNMVASSKANSSAGNIWVLAAQSLTSGVSSSVRAKMAWTDIE